MWKKEVWSTAKQKDFFAFRCPDTPDVLMEKLQQQVKLLTDREYLLRTTESGFELGIGRGGHQGGYWYCATVTNDECGCVITGQVKYLSWDGKEVKMTWIDRIEFAILFVLLIPLVIIVRIYRIFRPEITDEDRFVEFMMEQMNCDLLK